MNHFFEIVYVLKTTNDITVIPDVYAKHYNTYNNYANLCIILFDLIEKLKIKIDYREIIFSLSPNNFNTPYNYYGELYIELVNSIRFTRNDEIQGYYEYVAKNKCNFS